MVMKSLQEFCIGAVSQLLLTADTSRVNNLKIQDENNPFLGYPSNVVENLLNNVVAFFVKRHRTLKFYDLKLLLSCHRIKHFELHRISIVTSDFIQITQALAKQGQNIEKLVIQKINFLDLCGSGLAHCPQLEERNQNCDRANAIQRLLLFTLNLRSLTIDISFNTSFLQHLKNLERVELNFCPRPGGICNLAPAGTCAPKLMHIAVMEDASFQLPSEDVLFLLEQCPSLVSFENCIARALELLCVTVENEDVLPMFQLRKAILGTSAVAVTSGSATPMAVKTAAATCPFLSELEVTIDTVPALHELSNFSSLKSLHVEWADLNPCEMIDLLAEVLVILGSQLQVLSVINFKNVDFAATATLCPHLKKLKLEYANEITSYSAPKEALLDLEELSVEAMYGDNPSAELLMMLLRNSQLLKVLHISCATALNDNLLGKILEKNSLANLVQLVLVECSLTDVALVQLLTACSNLKLLSLTSSLLTLDDIFYIKTVLRPDIYFTSHALAD